MKATVVIFFALVAAAVVVAESTEGGGEAMIPETQSVLSSSVGAPDVGLMLKQLDSALELAFGEEKRNAREMGEDETLFTDEEEDSHASSSSSSEENEHNYDSNGDDVAAGSIVASVPASFAGAVEEIASSSSVVAPLSQSPLRCEAVLNKLKKRDAQEAAKTKQELSMIKLVRLELQKLINTKDISSKNLEIAEGSDTEVMLLSLGLGRNHKEVGQVSALLDALEKKLNEQLHRFETETEQNRVHCVDLCVGSVNAQNKKIEGARSAHDAAQKDTLKRSAVVNKEEGELSELRKEEDTAKKAEAKDEKIRARELALLNVLQNKLTAFENVKIADIEADLETSETRVGLKDWTNDAKDDERLAPIATALLERKYVETNNIRSLISKLINEILAERAAGEASLHSFAQKITAKKDKVQVARAEFVVTQRKEVAAQDFVAKQRETLSTLRNACRNFALSK